MLYVCCLLYFFFSSRRRHTRLQGDWSSDVCSSDLRTTLPPYLAFFSGKRSVPIVTALAAGLAGVVLSAIWPPIQHGIDTFSHWAAVSNPRKIGRAHV